MGKQPFWGLNPNSGATCNEEPTYFDDPWDTFFINTDHVPGFCEVSATDLAQLEIEKKKGKNATGATISILGYEPGSFDVMVRIVTPAQWDAFQDLRNRYWAGPDKAAKPPAATVMIGHPDLNSLNVYRAVIKGFSPGVKGEVEGAKYFRIRFHEEVKKKATRTVKAAGATPPEDLRKQPPSAALKTSEDPTEKPANMSLAGPPRTSTGGTL